MSFIIQEQAGGVIADDFDVSNYSVALPISVNTALTTVSTTVNLTTTSEMLLISTNNGTVAVVFDSASNAFGNAVLVRASVSNAAVNAVKISSTEVFVASLVASTTALETVVLSVSGTTITVNTPLATTLSATASFLTKSLIQVGSSFVLCVSRAAGPLLIAFTVSGTTITAGSEVLRTNSATTVYLVPYSSTVFMVIDYPTSSLTTNFAPYSVSGTTITAGTATTDTIRVNSAIGTSTNGNLLATGPNTSVTTTMRGVVVTITGTVATVSAVDMVTGLSAAVVSYSAMMFGNQMMVAAGGSGGTTQVLTGLTDVAGVATAAVNYFAPFSVDIRVIGFDQSGNVFVNNSTYSYFVARFVGNDVVATPVSFMKPQNSSSTIPVFIRVFDSLFGTYESRFSSNYRTAEGKVSGTTTTYAFAYSCKVNEIPEVQQAFFAFSSLPSTLSEAQQWGTYRTGSTLFIQKVVLT